MFWMKSCTTAWVLGKALSRLRRRTGAERKYSLSDRWILLEGIRALAAEALMKNLGQGLYRFLC
jgi:hypothetical protein